VPHPDLEPSCLWAHSAPYDGRARHLLSDHLYGTAALAERFARPFQAGPLARYGGLIHDVGKAAPDWQAKLAEVEALDHQAEANGHGGRRTPVGIDHKTAGAWLAWTSDLPNKRLGQLVSLRSVIPSAGMCPQGRSRSNADLPDIARERGTIPRGRTTVRSDTFWREPPTSSLR
jgi:hypothetical protein